jgi:Ca2+-binding EF-hand superfamily protein
MHIHGESATLACHESGVADTPQGSRLMCNRFRLRRFLVLAPVAAFAAVATVGAAGAQQRRPDPAPYFASMLTPETHLQEFTAVARLEFRKADLDRDGTVSQTDARIEQENWTLTVQRAALMELLACDLDLDGIVTREEVVRHESDRVRRSAYLSPAARLFEPELQRRIDVGVARLMQADRNGDNRIDWEEMLAFARQAPVTPKNIVVSGQMLGVILAMDEDGDGSVTLAEFDRAMERIFRTVDRNGDGVLSKEEIDGFRVRLEAERNAAFAQQRQEFIRQSEDNRRAACALPKPSAAAQVVLLGIHHGDALSTVTIGDQDIPVETGIISIEPGQRPLYLIISSYAPTIWRVTGTIERLERLVLAGNETGANTVNAQQMPLIGATGIAAERIAFLGRPGCIDHFVSARLGGGRNAAEAVRQQTGQEPVLIGVENDGVAAVAIPSGDISRIQDTTPMGITVRDNAGRLEIASGTGLVRRDVDDAQHRLRTFHPGGIVEIDPRTVVASRTVQPYETLPQEAGLLQLIQSGALVETPGSADKARPPEYQIRRRIRLPSGLHGAHRVKFVVARGVPTPIGDPGHSCVLLEEGGPPIANGSACR